MSTTTEAAKRLRNDKYDDHKAEMAFFNEHNCTQREADCETLASAYLAEHPEDDAEPITEQWLRSVMQEYETGECSRKLFDAWPIRCVLRWDGPVNPWRVLVYLGTEAQQLSHIKTRGDLRLLCRALSITLKA